MGGSTACSGRPMPCAGGYAARGKMATPAWLSFWLLRRTSGQWTGRPFRLRLGRAEVARLRRRVKPAAPSEFSKWRLSGTPALWRATTDNVHCTVYTLPCEYLGPCCGHWEGAQGSPGIAMVKPTRTGAVCFGGWQGKQELRKNIIECVNPDCLVPALSHSWTPPRHCNHTPRPGLRPASIPSRDTHHCHNPTHPPPHLQTAPYLSLVHSTDKIPGSRPFP